MTRIESPGAAIIPLVGATAMFGGASRNATTLARVVAVVALARVVAVAAAAGTTSATVASATAVISSLSRCIRPSRQHQLPLPGAAAMPGRLSSCCARYRHGGAGPWAHPFNEPFPSGFLMILGEDRRHYSKGG